jgi:uncharacterized protein YjdB
MKKVFILLILVQISVIQYGQIIADHTVVDKYDEIPQYYVDEVKKMLVDIAGESHSLGYRIGQNLLELLDSRFQVLTYDGTPPAYSTQYLRLGRHGSTGEDQFYTSQTAINSYKTLITNQNNSGNPFNVIGFGWCWDMTWLNSPGGVIDPIHKVRWAGSSVGGPEGNLRWGLDNGDQSLTGNSVCMDTYLNAVNQYIQHCNANGYPTKVIFTTGPVDGNAASENGYQREIKHDYIRSFVQTNIDYYLFDYADILCWSNEGTEYITNWNDGGTLRPHANIHPDNMYDYDASWNKISHTEDGDHIGEVGTLRLAKAMWWLLARIAGWDGGINSIPVTGITVTGTGGATTITSDNGTLQLTATVTPSDATNKTVTWSVVNGTGQATINSTGLVTAVSNGTVTARATANDGSGIVGSLVITISGQVMPVTGITVTGAGGSSVINSDNGQLQLTATVLPSDATNKTVTWSIVNATGQATINSTGLVTAVSNGTVTARAAANDGSGVVGSLVITISGQVIPVTGITVTGTGGATSITSDNGTLQLTTTVAPSNATNKTVTWSIVNGTGQATINSTGLVTAVSNGTVTARATATDGSGVVGSLVITISGQVIPVTSIAVTGASGATTITSDNGTLQLTATVAPTNATNKTITWSVANGTGQATINSTGLVTAASNGTVTARATANDGSGVTGTLVITITNQFVPVTNITVTGASGATTITSDNGTLQLTATVTPSDATNKTVTWSIVNGTGQATINSTGLVTAVSNGTVTARATANDGSGVTGTLVITITNQFVPVTNITVTGASGATTITSDNGTLQLTATVTPSDATNKTVTWSIVNGTGQATINSTGLVTAVSNGTVTARATATDGSGVVGSLVITISGQAITVTGITVTGANGATTITSDNGTLQLTATVAPTNATNKTVTWSIVNGTGQATINSTGLVTAVSNGTVTARATATDGSGVVGSLVITISGQVIPVTGITVTGTGGATTITSDNGTLQLTATVAPSNATNKTVTWSIVNGTGQATINSTGLVTAIANGTVTARATATDGSGVVGSLVITISGQVIPVTGITVTGANGATTITSDNGTLQLTATIAPSNATNKTVTWSIVNGTGQATINSTGFVTAVSGGTVTARATATDGSGVVGLLVITISGQVIPVTGITVTGTGGATTITSDNGTLQLTATVAPTNATNKTVTWSIVNGTGQATINSTGLVTAVAGGTVTARATATDGSGVVGSLVITISGQVIPVTGITVTGTGGATTITSDNGTLQLTATVAPANATNKTVTWSIVNGTGQATINSTGLVTAVSGGTVTARATATDGSGVVGSLVITISGQVIPVTGITVTGASGATTITSDNGTLQLTATVAPSNATNKTVTWSIASGTGQATINSTGLVTAVSNGTVTAKAIANDGSGVAGSLVITITGQSILVTRIDIASTKGEAVITTQNGTLQLTATVQPANATNQTVTWSIINGAGQATISPSGLVTAVANGTVTARATAADGSGIYGQLIITISNQFVAVAGITVSGEGGVTTVSSDDGTLQMVAMVAPITASNKAVTWSLAKGSGHATISETGLLTARSNGIVTVRATSTDGSSVFGEREITLINQIVKITAIKVKPKSASTSITTVNGDLQLTAEIEPADATDQTVTWSVINGTGMATINEKGLLVGDAPGEVTVVASAADGSGVAGELTVMIDLVESIKIRYTRNEIVVQVPDRLIPAKVSLHNLQGSHIQTKVIDMTECVIDISSLMPGIYVVSVYNSIVHDAAKIAISY